MTEIGIDCLKFALVTVEADDVAKKCGYILDLDECEVPHQVEIGEIIRGFIALEVNIFIDLLYGRFDTLVFVT